MSAIGGPCECRLLFLEVKTGRGHNMHGKNRGMGNKNNDEVVPLEKQKEETWVEI